MRTHLLQEFVIRHTDFVFIVDQTLVEFGPHLNCISETYENILLRKIRFFENSKIKMNLWLTSTHQRSQDSVFLIASTKWNFEPTHSLGFRLLVSHSENRKMIILISNSPNFYEIDELVSFALENNICKTKQHLIIDLVFLSHTNNKLMQILLQRKLLQSNISN